MPTTTSVRWSWPGRHSESTAIRCQDWWARKVGAVLPWVLVGSGHLDGMLDPCAQVLAQARAAGDLIDQADTLFLMAVLARQTGRLADAGAHLREAAELSVRVGYRMRVIDVLDEGGYWCAAAGRYAAAVTLWSARNVRAEAAGFSDTPAEIHGGSSHSERPCRSWTLSRPGLRGSVALP